MLRIIEFDRLIELLSQHDHRELHVHHTWKPDHSSFNGSNHLELQNAMRNYHINTLGWSDIGQHVSLFPDGLLVTGRDFNRTPASIKGKNSGAFAVEMIGNFDVGHDTLEGKQLDSILRIAKYFDDKGKYVRFHRENSGKTCPGSSIDKDWFINKVQNYDSREPLFDVEGHWAESEIREALKSGLLTGYPDGSFQPDKEVTRAEVAVILSRISK